MLSSPESPPGIRASFAKHNIWATPFQAEERFGGGRHTVMHSGEGGLDDMTSKDRSISECDLVTWHTFGVTHLPRPEDWPVMPVEYCGFHLIRLVFLIKIQRLIFLPAVLLNQKVINELICNEHR